MSKGPWLTKSRFLAGEQCPKRLWQQCHSPLEDGNELSPITETGLEVGRLAHRLFLLGFENWLDDHPGKTAADFADDKLTDSVLHEFEVWVAFQQGKGAWR